MTSINGGSSKAWVEATRMDRRVLHWYTARLKEVYFCPSVFWEYPSHYIIWLVKLLHSEESTTDETWAYRLDPVSTEIPGESTAVEFCLLLYGCHCNADIPFTSSCVNARRHSPEAEEHCSHHPTSWISYLHPKKRDAESLTTFVLEKDKSFVKIALSLHSCLTFLRFHTCRSLSITMLF